MPSRQQLNDSCHKRRYWFMQILVEKAIKQFGRIVMAVEQLIVAVNGQLYDLLMARNKKR